MPRKVARKEDLRTRLAELSGWRTATRDDALVAEDLHESRAMDRIYPLSEAVFFDEFFHYIGEIGARPLFEGLAAAFAGAEDADFVVCTGLFNDEGETPEDYRPLLERLRARKLAMICANPDLVVARGTKLIYCAGALADLYTTLGGEVVYAGKPHRPIYEDALAMAAARGRRAPLERVLAIGDSIRTDLAGARNLGIDCLFVTDGIHSEELRAREAPQAGALVDIFAEAGVVPTAFMRRLVW